MAILKLRWMAVLCGLASFAYAEELTNNLDTIKVLEIEKTGSDLVTPKIVVEGKTLADCTVRIHPQKGVSVATPTGPGSATLNRVFFDPKSGGFYVSAPDSHPEVEAGASSRFLKLRPVDDKNPLTAEQEAENRFIPQMARLLVQRHKSDPSISKMIEFYFPVKTASTLFDFGAGVSALTPASNADPVDKLIHFIERPSAWEGQACTDEECVFTHPDMGKLVLPHPGAADLILKPSDLVEAKEEELPLAPEVRNETELEAKLREFPESVTTVYFLISHENCPPCREIKRNERQAQGLWAKFCRKIRRSDELAALMENATQEPKAATPIMQKYGCQLQFPQILIFHRDEAGNWKAPEVVTYDKFKEILD